jgi:hypothetical protein
MEEGTKSKWEEQDRYTLPLSRGKVALVSPGKSAKCKLFRFIKTK